MPGFFLDHSISSGKLARARPQTAIITDIALYVGYAIPVHLLTITSLQLLGFLGQRTIDFRLFLSAVTGDFSNPTASLDILSVELASNKWRIAGYLFGTVVVAVVLGRLIQYVLLRSPVKRLLPLQNQWFNTFFLPNWERIGQCHAFVLTKTQAFGGPLLYQGFVSDFRTDVTGNLAEIRLRSAQRCSLAPGADPQGTLKWTDLEQDLLIVPGSEITNLTLSHVRVWRPYWVMGRFGATVTAGQKASVQMPQKRILGYPDGIYVLCKPPTDKVVTTPASNGVVNIECDPKLKGKVDLQIVGVKRIKTDSLSENTGNPLFWFERRLVDWWTGRVERQAAAWE